MSWEEIKFGDVVSLRQGFAVNSKSNHYIVEDGLPLLKISDLFKGTETLFVKKEIPKQFLVSEDEIIYSRTGNSLAHAFMGRKGVLYNNCFKITPNEERINKIFLYKILNTTAIRKYAQTLATGTAQPDLNHDAFKSIKIKLPPLFIQQKMVNLISKYDNLIENNNTRIKLLENMAEELYKEWFIRLRFPNYQNTKIVDGIPDGWEKNNLDNYLEFFRGKSYSSEDIASEEGLPFVNLKCINRNGGFRRDGLKVFSGKYQDGNIAYSGDIIMAVTDMTQDRAIVGRVGRIPKMDYEKFIFSMDTIRIEPIEIDKIFLYILLRFSNIGLYLKEFANGANVLHLTPDIIYKTNTLMPDSEIQLKFTNIIKPILNEIDILQLKNQNLKQTRDLLLPRLISGKLDIKDFDIKA